MQVIQGGPTNYIPKLLEYLKDKNYKDFKRLTIFTTVSNETDPMGYPDEIRRFKDIIKGFEVDFEIETHVLGPKAMELDRHIIFNPELSNPDKLAFSYRPGHIYPFFLEGRLGHQKGRSISLSLCSKNQLKLLNSYKDKAHK